eukprot:jgi/Chrzof1/13405/Cz07g31230.t1
MLYAEFPQAPCCAPIYSQGQHPAAIALRDGSMGVGVSGSGFLIFYVVGVMHALQVKRLRHAETPFILDTVQTLLDTLYMGANNYRAFYAAQKLGILKPSTAMAGDGTGLLITTASCSGLTYADMYKHSYLYWYDNLQSKVNGTNIGSQDQVWRKTLDKMLPQDVATKCSDSAWMPVPTTANTTATSALVHGFSSREELIDTAAASASQASYSAFSSTVAKPGLSITFEGRVPGSPIPCPPGVKYCVKITAIPNDPRWQASSKIPVTQSAAFKADIWPGLSGETVKYTPLQHLSWLVQPPPDKDVLEYFYKLGVKDGAFWASKTGMATAAQQLNDKVALSAAIRASSNSTSNGSTIELPDLTSMQLKQQQPPSAVMAPVMPDQNINSTISTILLAIAQNASVTTQSTTTAANPSATNNSSTDSSSSGGSTGAADGNIIKARISPGAITRNHAALHKVQVSFLKSGN